MARSQEALDAARDRRFAELRDWVAAHDTSTLTSHAYGDDPEQVADLRVPDGPGPHPLAVLVHGGNWLADRSRTLMAPMAVDLTRRGWATWNIEYRRLGNGGGASTTMDDVASAIKALDAVQVDIDYDRAVLLGHSSGAQLALTAAQQRPWTAVVAIAGYCDLQEAWRQGTGAGAVEKFCGGGPSDVPQVYLMADPSLRLPTRRRLVVVHGEDDERVPQSQSRRFAETAEAAGDECTLIVVRGADHFTFLDPRTSAWRDVVDAW